MGAGANGMHSSPDVFFHCRGPTSHSDRDTWQCTPGSEAGWGGRRRRPLLVYHAAVSEETGQDEDQSTPAAPALETGARFGDLVLGDEIGRGAQGVVFAGHQVSIDRRVAVKVLPREVAFTQEQVDRFHREAEAAARLSHQNIVAAFGLEEAHGHHLLLQEFVDGGSLEDICEQRRLAVQQTDINHCSWSAGIVRQLADGLQHAHEHKIIHRDMKPANVLMTQTGIPKISDFGLARLEDKLGLSRTGAVMGTPHYMSPEQIQAKPDGVDARTDVYSLGALLYRLLTNRVPFASDSMQSMFLDILTRAPKPPRKIQPGVHADLEAVCLKALEKSPDDRYASAADFAADLGRFLAGESTEARPLSVVGRSFRSLKLLATSTLAVVALLVPTAWFALDFWLSGRAASDVNTHDLRLGLAAASALLLAWPLSLLGVRLARARRWGALPAWGLALGLGAVAVLGIHEQKTAQLHSTDRGALTTAVRRESVGDRIDVGDLVGYETAWGERFGLEDRMLLAYAYLKRERPTVAESWTRAADETDAGDQRAVHDALRLAIHVTLGREDEARRAAADLERSSADAGWADWRLIGDLYRDLGRADDARAAFVAAGRLPDADRDQLNLELAQLLVQQCRFTEAQDYLDDFIKWKPDDADANLALHVIAREAGRWAIAERALDVADDDPAQTGRVLDLRDRYLQLRGAPQALVAHRRRDFDDSTPPQVVAWCGTRALQAGEQFEADAQRLSAGGESAAADQARADALDWYEYGRDCFERLIQPNAAPLLGQLGLARASRRLAARADDPGALLRQAAEHAQAAIDLDPHCWRAAFALGRALRGEQVALRGSPQSLSSDDIDAYLVPMVRAIELNGSQTAVLHDAAQGLVTLSRRKDDPAAGARARDLLERAIRTDAARLGSDCERTTGQRALISSCQSMLSALDED